MVTRDANDVHGSLAPVGSRLSVFWTIDRRTSPLQGASARSLEKEDVRVHLMSDAIPENKIRCDAELGTSSHPLLILFRWTLSIGCF